MFLNDELGPNNSPVPSTYPDPLLRKRPSLSELPFFHGERYSPCPVGIILQAVPFFFIYITPLPAILLTAVDPAADPMPASAPVAKDGRTLDRRNLPAVASIGSKAAIKPPSTYLLYASWALLILIVTPVPF